MEVGEMVDIDEKVKPLEEIPDWDHLQQIGHTFVDCLTRTDGTYAEGLAITKILFRRLVARKFTTEDKLVLEKLITDLESKITVPIESIIVRRRSNAGMSNINPEDFLKIGRRQQEDILARLKKIKAVSDAKKVKILLIGESPEYLDLFEKNFSNDFDYVKAADYKQLDRVISENPDIGLIILYAPLGYIYSIYYRNAVNAIRKNFNGFLIMITERLDLLAEKNIDLICNGESQFDVFRSIKETIAINNSKN